MEADARTREELVAAQRTELAELEAQLADPTALSALLEENRRLREGLDVLDAERRALRDSASWRLTRPLRRGLDLLRRLRGRGPS